MGLLIKNVTMFTNEGKDCVLTGYALALENSQIAGIGPEAALSKKFPEYEVLDGKGRFLLPGWINAHMHCYSTFARGLALHQSPTNFTEILENLWWKLDKALDAESNYYSAIIPAIAAVKSGVTTIIDHHASPMAINGSLERIENAFTHVGIRAALSYEVSDRDGVKRKQQGLDENARFIKGARQKMTEWFIFYTMG